MEKNVFIGFDFSMNKPACTILYDKLFYFFIWPRNLKKKKTELYLTSSVLVIDRLLPEVNPETAENSLVVLEHTIRSSKLANIIILCIDELLIAINANNTNIYIATEGLSFNSKGDAALNLATYKGVLLAKLYEHYLDKLKGLYTYSPISIKSTAGCSKKNDLQDKNKMIYAFMKEPINHQFKTDLINGKFIAKKNYIECVDDIVDSYFALKTLLKKEKFIK